MSFQTIPHIGLKGMNFINIEPHFLLREISRKH